MKLKQAQRNELRYALEDSGMPEILAFMAAQRADKPFDGNPVINCYFLWAGTPEGSDFWRAVWLCQLESMK